MTSGQSEQNGLEVANEKVPQSPSESTAFSDLYPERKGSRIQYTTLELMKGKNSAEQYKERCGINVASCLEWPLIKLMLGALKSNGCITDVYQRHVACDICKDGQDFLNQGGYDDSTNQVFLCANNIGKSFGKVHGTLLRNLIHMYDVCTRKVDFHNVNHLACMEIRKANLAGCNLGIHMVRLNPFYIKDKHAECVAKTAYQILGEKIGNNEAAKIAVFNVFPKCYKDLEPIGRRCKDQNDMKQAYKERYLFAYD